MNLNLTKNERTIIIFLLKAERSTVGFLSGFGKLTDEESKQEKFLNKLIDKLYE
jgi:hypothetical protein